MAGRHTSHASVPLSWVLLALLPIGTPFPDGCRRGSVREPRPVGERWQGLRRPAHQVHVGTQREKEASEKI